MFGKRMMSSLAAASILAGLTVGCETMSENPKTSGAAIGGVAGAAGGALIAKNEPILGALIGGAVGAGGGYLIGSQVNKSDKSHHDEAVQASQNAQARPVDPNMVKTSDTADLNHDGYVTLDEVVAMRKAGLSDQDMISRLERTGMFFELTPQQQQFLRDNGVSDRVIGAMATMNPNARAQAMQRMQSAAPPPSPGSTPVGQRY
jgi:Glycine zipper 2TM domain